MAQFLLKSILVLQDTLRFRYWPIPMEIPFIYLSGNVRSNDGEPVATYDVLTLVAKGET